MSGVLHITSGDCAGANLAKAGLGGDVLVWRDILYDGPPRRPGWPDEDTLAARAVFLEQTTGGGLSRHRVLETLRSQYRLLEEARTRERVVLWFDACLFDQSMLVHILACLRQRGIYRGVELVCVDSFPGVNPFHGLGQLSPEQLAPLFPRRRAVSREQLAYAVLADEAFATSDTALLARLANATDAPLPWIAAAASRWLQEWPDPATGLGRLERVVMEAVRAGCESPLAILAAASAAEIPPQFWGDTTLWAKINALAARKPPLLRIEGPAPRLPQWVSSLSLDEFRVSALA